MKRTPRGRRRRRSLRSRPCGLPVCRLRSEPLEKRLVLTPVIDVGDHLLRPGTLGQEIDIYVQSDNEEVVGLNFNAQVADGGVELGGAYEGPEIQDLVIFNGSDPPDYLFDGNNTGTEDLDGPWPYPTDVATQFEVRVTTTVSGAVPANGLLGTVTIATVDTFPDPDTPFTSGTWDLFLSDTLNGPTDFSGVLADVTDGTITVSTPPTADPGSGYSVPEGGTIGLDGSGSSDHEEAFTWVSPVTGLTHHLTLDSIVEYEWDLDGDGVFGETGAAAQRGDELGVSPTFSAAGLDGDNDSPWPISLKVKDTTDLWSDPVASHILITNTEVVGRHVFYNDSVWDESPGNLGGDPAANAYDDNAIAPDKTALLPGETADVRNYTSYSKGLNGVIIDIAGLKGTPTADDFVFRMGNDGSPDAWPLAPKPPNENITVRPGEGAGGSDRVTILWPNYDTVNPDPATQAVAKKWLQVTVLPTPNTGLAEPDVFYFGNALGDSGTGNFGGVALVNAVDSGAVRDNPHNPLVNPAPLDDFADYNRDQWVNAADFGLVRDNATNPSTALKLITAPSASPSPGPEAAAADRGADRAALHDAALGKRDIESESLADAKSSLPDLFWFDVGDLPVAQGRSSNIPAPRRSAVEKLLTTL